MQQLDLFRKPAAEVLAFPLWKRRDLVAATAKVLWTKQGKAADRYWRSVAKVCIADLIAARVPRREAESQVSELFEAVQGELLWMAIDNAAKGGAG
ncbi:DUF6074 family protein [Borborobacter arsenicus]|uniref:DUF6074 family protein n=1 Tax=Borborobacter arsenicus TaxID=1851146 RepID=UPI001FDF83A3|nr:DUF6074 family protein [Pseudaminobacter arsenicus]